MTDFAQVPSDEPIADIIKSAFDVELAIDGGWGYDRNGAIVILETPAPLTQLQHTLVSMRSHIEMSMTLPEEERYSGINPSEVERDVIVRDGVRYNKITYAITAMRESDYKQFIDAYKAGYGKEEFDIKAHFTQRKEATLHRTVTVWFDVTPCLPKGQQKLINET